MGLELVEFALVIEERFQVRFDEDELGETKTLRDVATVLSSRFPRSEGPCAHQRVFHGLRRELAPERHAFKPVTPLATLIGRDSRERWQSLHRRTGWKLPRRQLAPVARALAIGTIGAAAIGTSFTLGIAPAIAAGTAGAFAYRSTSQWLGELPFGTVGALTRAMVHENHGLLLRQGVAFREREVLAGLCLHAADQFGWPLEALGPETQLRDLAVDG